MLNDIARPLHAVKERYKVSSGGDVGGNKIYMLIFFLISLVESFCRIDFNRIWKCSCTLKHYIFKIHATFNGPT